jgi:ATP-binding cassette subfamily F protein 3
VYFLNAIASHVLHVRAGKVTLYPGGFQYFRERQAKLLEEDAHEQGRDAEEAPAELTPEQSQYEASKEARRRAKAREKAEAELERLHGELERLAAEMSDPKLYEDFNRVQKIGEDMERVQAAVQLKEEEVQRLRD